MIQSHGAKYDCNLQRQHAERDAKVTSAMDVQDVFVFIRPANPHLQTSDLQDTSEFCKELNH